MAWLDLFVAGVFEVLWTYGLKLSNGFTRPIPSILTAISLFGSMWFLAKSTQIIPLGTAYVVWVGIGALGATVLGVVAFNETVTVGKMVFVSLLVVSIIGLKLTS